MVTFQDIFSKLNISWHMFIEMCSWKRCNNLNGLIDVGEWFHGFIQRRHLYCTLCLDKHWLLIQKSLQLAWLVFCNSSIWKLITTFSSICKLSIRWGALFYRFENWIVLELKVWRHTQNYFMHDLKIHWTLTYSPFKF